MGRFGMLNISPSDYVIIFKNGKIAKEGRGLSFFCYPWTQYVIIPSGITTIPFVADQITNENQGVEVAGFAIWKIKEPNKTYLHFDFFAGNNPVELINKSLKDVVESAIRHMVANMSIENVLRKRGTIILQLKQELEYICDQWGISIDTIEIKDVKILSKALFSNMQATFRNKIRLESETSSMLTEQEITTKKLHHEEQMSIAKQANRLRETERQTKQKQTEMGQREKLESLGLEKDLRIKKQEEQQKVELDINRQTNKLKEIERHSKIQQTEITQKEKTDSLRLEKELEIQKIEEAHKVELYETKLASFASEKQMLDTKTELDNIRKESWANLERISHDVNRERISADNTQDAKLMLYKQLPTIIKSLKIDNLSIGEDRLLEIVKEIFDRDLE